MTCHWSTPVAPRAAARCEADKHQADLDVSQFLTTEFDHANASFAVNAIVTDKQMQRLRTLQERQ
jgi:hypothetical protein